MGLLHKARPLTSTPLEGPDVILALLTAESVEGRESGPSDMVGVSVQVLESSRKLDRVLFYPVLHGLVDVRWIWGRFSQSDG